jgi:Holliday junction resolvase RusA-like endonuclease
VIVSQIKSIFSLHENKLNKQNMDDKININTSDEMNGMIFESTIQFEPTSLKRHRHRLKGGTYDPSKKEKDDFVKSIENFPSEKMTKPIQCILQFHCKRPRTHFRSGKYAHVMKNTAPKYNVNNKDLDNMVKFVLDALNDKLYTDDSLIFQIECKKLYVNDAESSGHIYAKFTEVVE